MASLNLTGVGLREGEKMKNTSSFIRRLSKAAQPGSNYRLFIPKFKGLDGKDNVFTPAVVGRELDFDVFKKGFITYKEDWIDDSKGYFEDLTGIEVPARISRVIFEAQCAKEKAEAQKKAEDLAAASGEEVNIAALAVKQQQIEEKYHGRKGQDGVPAVMPSVKPAIKGLSTQLILEMLLVPMDSTTNTPKWDAAEYVYKTLSKRLITTLLEFLDNPMYNDASKSYLEVSFTYGKAGQSSKQAGQEAQWNGVTPSVGLEAMFADSWNAAGRDKVAGLCEGKLAPIQTSVVSEEEFVKVFTDARTSVCKRTGFIEGSMTPSDVKSLLNQWAVQNVTVLLHIDVTNPVTIQGAEDLVNSGIVDNVKNVKDKLIDVIKENGGSTTPAPQATEAAPQTTPTEQMTQPAPEPQPTVEPAPQVSEPAPQPVTETPSQVGGVDLRAAMGSNSVPDTDDDELGDIL